MFLIYTYDFHLGISELQVSFPPRFNGIFCFCFPQYPYRVSTRKQLVSRPAGQRPGLRPLLFRTVSPTAVANPLPPRPVPELKKPVRNTRCDKNLVLISLASPAQRDRRV